MNAIHFQYYQSPLGELILGSFDGKLCLCDWRYRKGRRAIDSRLQKGLKALLVEGNCPLLKKTTHHHTRTRCRFNPIAPSAALEAKLPFASKTKNLTKKSQSGYQRKRVPDLDPDEKRKRRSRTPRPRA